METLISDCFPSIFSYLTLSDLLNLRRISRRMKAEVDAYLPHNVRSLPLYLTTPRTPEAIATYEYLIRSHEDYHNFYLPSSNPCLRRLSFGSSPGTFEDGTILQNQPHFRFADFVIINSSSKLRNFLVFIKKLCPNIEKLALVIDHSEHYLREVVKIIEAFPVIKVLLIESTFQDSCRYDDNGPITRESEFDDLWLHERNQIIIPPEVYESILALKKLEELYFFPKQKSQSSMLSNPADDPINPEMNDGTEDVDQNFVMSLLRRLRVFHYNCNCTEMEMFIAVLKSIGSYELPIVEKPAYESIEELTIVQVMWSSFKGRYGDGPRAFLELKKLIVQKNCYTFFLWMTDFFECVPGLTLKVLDLTQNNIALSQITHFRSLPALEQIHCGGLWITKKEHEAETVSSDVQNRTVKHLRTIAGPETVEKRNQVVLCYKKFFPKLETCVFLEPEYCEYHVRDLRI